MKGFNKQLFAEILVRYNSGKASKEEVRYIEAYYNLFEINAELDDDNLQNIKDAVKLKVEQQIDSYENNNSKPNTRRIVKISMQQYAAAAVIFITVSIGTYFLLQRQDKQPAHIAVQADHSPGSNKAILTLANGKKIVLDKSANREIVQLPGMTIKNTSDGQIIYTITADQSIVEADQSRAEAGKAMRLNTISTSRGGQYQVVLSDGTRVWLNSASSITYPTTFDHKQRLVELHGEAYFEVAKNKNVPFSVKTAQQTVEVLGTHFNINSYTDEPLLKTTLLEGSVKVVAGDNQVILTPGQQLKLNFLQSSMKVDNHVDLDKVLAWKNGVFSFENEDLKSIMRQVARWYNVDVVYSGIIANDKFFGEISRNSNLSQVLKILELNNVHFDITGKTIRVSENVQSPAK